VSAAELLLQRGTDTDDDTDKYAPEEELEDISGSTTSPTDCRPITVTETDSRRKRPIFDSLINHHTEYQPYISTIYTRCFPTGSVQVAKPPVGWTIAEAVRDKYYFDEILTATTYSARLLRISTTTVPPAQSSFSAQGPVSPVWSVVSQKYTVRDAITSEVLRTPQGAVKEFFGSDLIKVGEPSTPPSVPTVARSKQTSRFDEYQQP